MIRFSLVLLVVVLAAILPPQDIFAQNGVGKNRGDETPESRRQLLLERQLLLLECERDEIVQACSLDEADMKRINAGIKGCMSKLTTEWENFDAMVAERGNRMARQHKPSNALEHQFWKDVIRKILTQEQKSMLTEVREKRRAFVRASAVDLLMAKLQVRLRLDDQQRAALTPLIDEKLGDGLAESLELTVDANGVLGYCAYRGVCPESPMFDPEKVNKILISKEQQAIWNKQIETELYGMYVVFREDDKKNK